MQPNFDQVILVDTNDCPTGQMDKVDAHRGNGKLHRAVSVFLFNSIGELLLQQRSQQKIVGANQWANSCCGNVQPGESYQECAQRRLREELGITVENLKSIHKFEYQVKCNNQFSEHEMDTVFVGKYEGEVTPNTSEVQQYEWKSISKVQKELQENKSQSSQKYAPWFYILIQQSPVATFLQ